MFTVRGNSFILVKKEELFFSDCIKELLQSEDVQSMRGFIQHAQVSCFEHSFSVAYISFRFCRKTGLHVDYKSMVRGALLHDFFLYDWHLKSDRKGLHGFTHPKAALQNAEKYFVLNDRERDIIVKHMWPLTPIPPRYREAFIVSAADKYCSLIETLFRHPAVSCIF